MFAWYLLSTYSTAYRSVTGTWCEQGTWGPVAGVYLSIMYDCVEPMCETGWAARWCGLKTKLVYVSRDATVEKHCCSTVAG